jgi:uncharacterized coiled-coil protein SlyX
MPKTVEQLNTKDIGEALKLLKQWRNHISTFQKKIRESQGEKAAAKAAFLDLMKELEGEGAELAVNLENTIKEEDAEITEYLEEIEKAQEQIDLLNEIVIPSYKETQDKL